MTTGAATQSGRVAERVHPAAWRVGYGTVLLGERARALIEQSLSSTRISTGPHVPEFERLFAKVIGAKHAIAVSSGTDACAVMMASLLDRGAQRGDEVIVPALTFCATANAVLMAGLTPTFVDIDRDTLNINPENIEQAITPRTRAIFPVHIMGKPAPMNRIHDIARRRGLFVFEDACQAHGAEYQGRRIGSTGMGASFSLYAAHLICVGEGGVITTSDDTMAALYRSIRSHGRPPGEVTFDFQRVGFNSKMDELSAAVGIEQVERYEELRKKRKYNLDTLTQVIGALPRAREWLWFQQQEEHEVIGPQGFPFVVKEEAPFTREELITALAAARIEWKTLFGSLPTQHAAYAFLGHAPGDFPEAEFVGRGGLHIGVHPGLLQSDLEYVLDTFQQFLARY